MLPLSNAMSTCAYNCYTSYIVSCSSFWLLFKGSMGVAYAWKFMYCSRFVGHVWTLVNHSSFDRMVKVLCGV